MAFAIVFDPNWMARREGSQLAASPFGGSHDSYCGAQDRRGGRIYDAAKTVADCFKFRNKIGIDVAAKALRDYLRRRNRNIDAL
jgi:hypothetical protein